MKNTQPRYALSVLLVVAFLGGCAERGLFHVTESPKSKIFARSIIVKRSTADIYVPNEIVNDFEDYLGEYLYQGNPKFIYGEDIILNYKIVICEPYNVLLQHIPFAGEMGRFGVEVIFSNYSDNNIGSVYSYNYNSGGGILSGTFNTVINKVAKKISNYAIENFLEINK